METQGFSDHGLNRCGSILKRPIRNPPGKRRQCRQPARVGNALKARSGFPEGMRPREAACLLVDEVPAVGAGRRLRHGEATCLPTLRFGCLRESDCLVDSPPLVRSSASKTAGKVGWSVQKVRDRENMLRRIGADLLNDSPNCARTRRKDAVGLDGLDVSGGTPADKEAAR